MKMKKVFKKLNIENRYVIREEAQTQNFELQSLWSFLSAWGNKDPNRIHTSNGMCWEWLSLDKTEDGKTVYLWDWWEVKKQAKVSGLTQQEQEAFDEPYDEYHDKRRDDIPKLYMTIENYVEIVKKWQDVVLNQRPQYIILLQSDAGHIDLIGKDELSQQDLADMKREHEKYLKYQAAYDKYVKSKPDMVDELWHGPESSEYEADWQKFLDETLD